MLLPSTEITETLAVAPRRAALVRERSARVAALRGELETVADASCAAKRAVTLEIGCGHGHFLAAYATAHPAVDAIGIDFCRERIRRAVRKQQRERLAHLRFVYAEAGEFLEAVPQALQFDRVFILFPDPWPKRRHWKFRLINDGLLERLAQVCVEGAELCFRTDHNGYFAAAAQVFARSPFWLPDPDRAWPFERPTIFQEKADAFQSLVAVKAPRARG